MLAVVMATSTFSSALVPASLLVDVASLANAEAVGRRVDIMMRIALDVGPEGRARGFGGFEAHKPGAQSCDA